MWLILYIGSTAYVLTDAVINEVYFNRRLKKEGYKFTVKNHIGLTEILLGTLLLGAHLIPGVNLLFPFANRDREMSYDIRKNYLLEAGTIEEPNEIIHDNKKESIFNSKETIEETLDKLFSEADEVSKNDSIRIITPPDEDSLRKSYSYKKILK